MGLLTLPLYLNPHGCLSRSIEKRRRGINGRDSSVVLSSHSNLRLIKSDRRRSPYGRRIPPYDEDEEEEEESDDEESQSSDDEFDELDNFDGDAISGQKFSKSHSGNNARVNQPLQRGGRDGRPLNQRQNLKSSYGSRDWKNENSIKKMRSGDLQRATVRSLDLYSAEHDGREQSMDEKFTRGRFRKLSDELDFDEKWFPLIDYLSGFGLKESHFAYMYERHMPCLQINVASAQERLEFLLSVGVKHKDIKKILLRQPQILEYTVENNLKAHVAFLASIGIPDTRVGQIIAAAPSLLSYNVEHSLKPTVRYLIEEVGIKGTDISKVVQLSPQILVQRIDNSWTSRYGFLSKELGASRESIVKMVAKHPQLLHYSIEDGILPRINFLRSIGMRNSEILKVLTSLTQVLSLSLEGNLRPKYLYLVNELRNEVKSLTKYPMYLSLSLDQRIRPRHRFLVSLKKDPKGPFPLSSLVPTDERFCRSWAGTSVDEYLAFRQDLLLKDFANKYERK